MWLAMMIKKSSVVIFSLLLLGLLLVSCTSSGPSKSFKDWVYDIGTLQFLGVTSGENTLIGFLRILIAVLIFVILYEVAHLFLTPNVSIAVSAILAIGSAIFIPGEILAGIFGAYATLFSLILIGAPVVGGLWAIWRIPGDTRGGIALRALILLILLWILLGVKALALRIIP